MSVTTPGAPDQSASPAPPPAICDRIVFYGSKDTTGRLKQQPIRAGAPIPMRFTDTRGVDWVMLSVVAVRPGETADQAIARETAELQALVDEIEASAQEVAR